MAVEENALGSMAAIASGKLDPIPRYAPQLFFFPLFPSSQLILCNENKKGKGIRFYRISVKSRAFI
jgi:hypothetical protein